MCWVSLCVLPSFQLSSDGTLENHGGRFICLNISCGWAHPQHQGFCLRWSASTPTKEKEAIRPHHEPHPWFQVIPGTPKELLFLGLGSPCPSQKCAWNPQGCLDDGPECVECRVQDSVDQKWMHTVRCLWEWALHKEKMKDRPREDDSHGQSHYYL